MEEIVFKLFSLQLVSPLNLIIFCALINFGKHLKEHRHGNLMVLISYFVPAHNYI